MSDPRFLEIMQRFFGVHMHEDVIELETWTKGGVNMFVILRTDEGNYAEQFKKYVEDFDVDEEIDLHRQADDYRSAFSVRESVRDFDSYEDWLKSIVEVIESDE